MFRVAFSPLTNPDILFIFFILFSFSFSIFLSFYIHHSKLASAFSSSTYTLVVLILSRHPREASMVPQRRIL